MAEERGPAEALMERIRADSAQTRLSPLSGLAAFAPEGADPAAMLAEYADADIKLMRGSPEIYYFSELSMTEGYARHLFRLAENDQARLIADLIRDESKLYPRPTPISAFGDAPYSLGRAEIEAALVALSSDPAYADVKEVSASNGDRYLFSDRFLTHFHAASLAEWASVGEKENP